MSTKCPRTDDDTVMQTLRYWAGVSECVCRSEHPIGACLRCDLENLIRILENKLALEKENKHPKLTLTVAEIRDLALFVGYHVDDGGIETRSEDELETEIVVQCPGDKGLEDDDGKVKHYAHVAWYEEYLDEGAMGLGPELLATDKGESERRGR